MVSLSFCMLFPTNFGAWTHHNVSIWIFFWTQHLFLLINPFKISYTVFGNGPRIGLLWIIVTERGSKGREDDAAKTTLVADSIVVGTQTVFSNKTNTFCMIQVWRKSKSKRQPWVPIASSWHPMWVPVSSTFIICFGFFALFLKNNLSFFLF